MANNFDLPSEKKKMFIKGRMFNMSLYLEKLCGKSFRDLYNIQSDINVGKVHHIFYFARNKKKNENLDIYIYRYIHIPSDAFVNKNRKINKSTPKRSRLLGDCNKK